MSRLRGTATAAVDLLLDGFVGYMFGERGVTVLTVERYLPEVRRDGTGTATQIPR